MDYRKEFERMMETQTEIALATSVDELPNVRIVNFYYDADNKTLYFSSFADNQKVAELEQNPRVAFTTIAKNGEEHVRVKNGMTRKSTVAVEEIKGKFLAKLPEYIMSIPDVLPALVLFDITFDNADVVLDFEHMDTITI
ncbi:pyridoxamine 5'-phosphate oxidase [Anaerotignum neopropionicum]|uniref:Pyridoxamine 5'-phosphate oxidase n=1 Tax=Anaerotignum neopropionicum TaxID=36847 RepID=A0A136WC91_9FIRM|nr:pyridoxamine 5'-phosphate oxidase family protein [Anaerotignum neopropionicum]KXL52114.1 pyridoxamine 5'-phosphate oxidase [Anaerotignum neopropionicum]